MAEFDRPTIAARPGTAAVVDAGLRSYMLRVYNYMGVGLVVTGLVAYFTYANSFIEESGRIIGLTGLGAALYDSPLKWVVMLAPLAFVLVLSFGITKLSVPVTQLLFWAFAAVMGLSLSSIFAVYTGGSIAKVFFISAATFGAMSLYGYTTKRDLTQFGSFLIMGLIGIVIASIVNIFLASSALSYAISIVGVLVFVGLTAWDTQNIKQQYAENIDQESQQKMTVFGALSLYLNFVNIFQLLLNFTGERE